MVEFCESVGRMEPDFLPRDQILGDAHLDKSVPSHERSLSNEFDLEPSEEVDPVTKFIADREFGLGKSGVGDCRWDEQITGPLAKTEACSDLSKRSSAPGQIRCEETEIKETGEVMINGYDHAGECVFTKIL